jgi:peptide/nickel transport system permease protein
MGTRYNPVQLSPADRLLPPSAAHFFGTDDLGRDVFTRVVFGARLSLTAAVVSSALSSALGLLVGGMAGFAGGAVDETLMRATDVFLAFPWMLLAMAVALAAGPSLWNAMVALALVWWPGYARLVRSQVLVVRSLEYVEAAFALGNSRWRILLKHIVPNIAGPYVTMLTVNVGRLILASASLSFLGLGAQPPAPEWGLMVAQGRTSFLNAWWIVTFPGLAILFASTAFNLLGDAVRDWLDPRRHAP